MSLLSFVTGAASLFSSANSGRTSERASSTQHSNASGETAATANESSSTTGTQTQSSTGSSTSSGTTRSTGATTGREASTTTGTTTNYSSDVLASLDSILTQQMGAGGGVSTAQQASDALAGRLQQLQATANQPAFDVNGYVSGITEAATAATQNDLDSRINSILSATGSSEGGNSMSALLGNKLRNDAAANLAGISSNARAQGEQIRMAQEQSTTVQLGELAGGLNAGLVNLLGAARGGQQATTGAATAVTTGTQTQSGSTAGTTRENVSSTGRTTEERDTTQSGITQTQESGTVSTRSRGNTQKGDLFTNILKAFTGSASAA